MEITIVFGQVFWVVFFGGFAGLTTWGAFLYGEHFIAKRRYYRSTRIKERERQKFLKKLHRENPAYFHPYK